MSDRARAAARKRAAGAPFAYSVGRAAFRHLTLKVDERVLIPRQETEQLVDLVLNRMKGRSGGIVADIGTGSGAIALALATETVRPGRAMTEDERPEHMATANSSARKPEGFDRIIATDISAGALLVAERNARMLLDDKSCPVEFRCGDMFSVIRETGLRAVVSNPPYVSFEEAESLPSSVRNWEPAEALYSARSGMLAIERVARGAARVLAHGGLLAMEVDSSRASLAADAVLSNRAFQDVSVERDLTGRERFVLATRT
jgi:release factor glutamine methyltransferase